MRLVWGELSSEMRCGDGELESCGPHSTFWLLLCIICRDPARARSPLTALWKTGTIYNIYNVIYNIYNIYSVSTISTQYLHDNMYKYHAGVRSTICHIQVWACCICLKSLPFKVINSKSLWYQSNNSTTLPQNVRQVDRVFPECTAHQTRFIFKVVSLSKQPFFWKLSQLSTCSQTVNDWKDSVNIKFLRLFIIWHMAIWLEPFTQGHSISRNENVVAVDIVEMSWIHFWCKLKYLLLLFSLWILLIGSTKG